MGSWLLPWINHQGYCLQYLLDCRRRSYMGWFIAIHQISGGIIWFKNQPACSINGNFTWAEALSMLVVLLVKIPVAFTALDYHQSIEIPTFHAHHLTHCGIPHAPKHSVISPDVFGALVVCFRGRNLYVYMPSTSDLDIWLWQFLPLKTANRSSNIKQKKQHPHTHMTRKCRQWCLEDLVYMSWAKRRTAVNNSHASEWENTWLPEIGSVVSHLAAELLAQQKNMLTNGVMFIGDYTFNSEIILFANCKLSSCKFCYGGTVALIRGYVTQLLGYKVQETSMASTIFNSYRTEPWMVPSFQFLSTVMICVDDHAKGP